MYEIIVLKEGYSSSEGSGHQKAGGTITLLKGPNNIIVDTGSPWDKDLIIKGLQDNNLCPEEIQYVVCSCGHSGKVGNLNLFPRAMLIVSYDVCKGDTFFEHHFGQGIPYEIDEFVEVIPTPGHTGCDVSVLVKNTAAHGTVAITGDLFERFEDLECPELWQDNSERPAQQEKSRISVLRRADYIVPGHGAMFQVPTEFKGQLRVVMVYEEHMVTNIVTTSNYDIFELDD